MKVIAFILCTMSVFLLIGVVSSSSWTDSNGWREGLFAQCVEKGTPLPLPLGIPEIEEGCFRIRSAGYIRGVAALIIIAIFTDFFGTLLTGLGLRSTDPNKKYKYYRVAIYSLLVAVLCLFLAVIIYPVSVSKDLAEDGNNPLMSGYYAVLPSSGDFDQDDDGIIDSLDTDDDNDGIADHLDDDDDNDGIPDDEDLDDDNDGTPDTEDKDIDLEDSDADGILDSEDDDDDGDGIPDALDNDDDGDGTPDEMEGADADLNESQDIPFIDTDKDGITDDKDSDIDGDGIMNTVDLDDDNDGSLDAVDYRAGDARSYSWGFGYGCSWCCLIFIFLSVVLLICDRESEEIFYKERAVEEEGEEEEEA